MRAPAATVHVTGDRGSVFAPSSGVAAIGTPEFMKEFSRLDGFGQPGSVFQGEPPDNC